MLYAVGNLFFVGHPLRVAVDERVEIFMAEAFVHVGEAL